MKKNFFALSLAAAMSLSLLSGCSNAPTSESKTPAPTPETGPYTYADTIAWDGQYDVVVVGFGGAGATASITAADEGAHVLLVEKAPEGHEGGNTKVCGQFFVYGNEDEEATFAYYQALAADHEIPEAMLRVYTQKIAHMYDVMEDLTGIPKSEYVDWSGTAVSPMSPEYPEFPGSDKITLNTLHMGASDSFLFKTLRNMVADRADKVDVWFESPATHLIQDPETKTILGVQVERGGKTLNIRATNGVVMACGGFENNAEMISNYLGFTNFGVSGTLYNTGDGIRMVQEVGADLWHMDAYEGARVVSASVPDNMNASAQNILSGAIFVIDEEGERYFDEGETPRHGHLKLGDSWVNIRNPLQPWAICDETVMEKLTASNLISDINTVYHADSIEKLATQINVPAKNLAATVNDFNSYAVSGNDIKEGRNASTMAPLSGNEYYAIAMSNNMLNTQGGPRRNENAEVIGLDGNPIPHLYAAGEFGGITAFQYQGGGNIAECVIFGQIAGKNAAAKKADLPTYEARQQVTSPLTYTPGTQSDLAAGGPDMTLAENEYLGVSHSGMGGDVYVKVTMEGDKIAKVAIVEHHETDGISDPAREQLPDAIVAAGSTEVDNVSGATITSKAIKEAVADALSQVK